MKTRLTFVLAVLGAVCTLSAREIIPSISGDYLEVRSCDVYTGPCVANAEMNLSGKEGMLVWSVREGSWKGVRLDGLSVVAVIHTDGTLGDLSYAPRRGKAVIILDVKAGTAQQAALKDLARTAAGQLLAEITEVKVANLEVSIGACKGGSCGRVKAGDLLDISTRCFGGKDHLCGNDVPWKRSTTPFDCA